MNPPTCSTKPSEYLETIKSKLQYKNSKLLAQQYQLVHKIQSLEQFLKQRRNPIPNNSGPCSECLQSRKDYQIPKIFSFNFELPEQDAPKVPKTFSEPTAHNDFAEAHCNILKNIREAQSRVATKSSCPQTFFPDILAPAEAPPTSVTTTSSVSQGENNTLTPPYEVLVPDETLTTSKVPNTSFTLTSNVVESSDPPTKEDQVDTSYSDRAIVLTSYEGELSDAPTKEDHQPETTFDTTCSDKAIILTSYAGDGPKSETNDVTLYNTVSDLELLDSASRAEEEGFCCETLDKNQQCDTPCICVTKLHGKPSNKITSSGLPKKISSSSNSKESKQETVESKMLDRSSDATNSNITKLSHEDEQQKTPCICASKIHGDSDVKPTSQAVVSQFSTPRFYKGQKQDVDASADLDSSMPSSVTLTEGPKSGVALMKGASEPLPATADKVSEASGKRFKSKSLTIEQKHEIVCRCIVNQRKRSSSRKRLPDCLDQEKNEKSNHASISQVLRISDVETAVKVEDLDQGECYCSETLTEEQQRDAPCKCASKTRVDEAVSKKCTHSREKRDTGSDQGEGCEFCVSKIHGDLGKKRRASETNRVAKCSSNLVQNPKTQSLTMAGKRSKANSKCKIEECPKRRSESRNKIGPRNTENDKPCPCSYKLSTAIPEQKCDAKKRNIFYKETSKSYMDNKSLPGKNCKCKILGRHSDTPCKCPATHIYGDANKHSTDPSQGQTLNLKVSKNKNEKSYFNVFRNETIVPHKGKSSCCKCQTCCILRGELSESDIEQLIFKQVLDTARTIISGTSTSKTSHTNSSCYQTPPSIQEVTLELRLENHALKSELKDMKLQLKECLEKYVAPLAEDMEAERRKYEQLQKELIQVSKCFSENENRLLKQMDSSQEQPETSCTKCPRHCSKTNNY